MMDKVKTMYDLMVEKFAASPHGRHQAEAYRKIRALADECDSVATMTVRLQNEGYNKLPAIALLTDKIEAHHRAALHNGLQEHADIYRRALDAIAADPDNAYLTGFYDDIRQANVRHAKTLERLTNCFDDYLHFRLRHETPPNARLALAEWKKEEKNLDATIRQKSFRSHFACSDRFLQRFIEEYEPLASGTIPGTPSGGIPGGTLEATPGTPKGEVPGTPQGGTPETTQGEASFEEAFNAIRRDEARRRSTARAELPRYRRAAAMSVAPATADGDYEYINIEFEE